MVVGVFLVFLVLNLNFQYRDNWLVAVESPYRHSFLILRCRLFLFLSCRRLNGCDCSPLKRERELGLDRCETG
jgi:hypothetical protein